MQERLCRDRTFATAPRVAAEPLLRSDRLPVLTVVAVDDTFVVVDKPSGLLSVPGRGPDKQDCLSARVQREFPDALIVHRLDMETSGLMVFARGLAAQRALSRWFEQRQVDKRYEAVADGLLLHDAGRMDWPLIVDWPNRPRQKVDMEWGKPSVTHYRVLHRDMVARTTRVELTPVTGRSHQLRVHLATLGHAILGDSLYASANVASASRLNLHATGLSFPHPQSATVCAYQSPAPF